MIFKKVKMYTTSVHGHGPGNLVVMCVSPEPNAVMQCVVLHNSNPDFNYKKGDLEYELCNKFKSEYIGNMDLNNIFN